jgi:hypothetical protein
MISSRASTEGLRVLERSTPVDCATPAVQAAAVPLHLIGFSNQPKSCYGASEAAACLSLRLSWRCFRLLRSRPPDRRINFAMQWSDAPVGNSGPKWMRSCSATGLSSVAWGRRDKNAGVRYPDNGQQLVDAIINALEQRVLVDPSAVDRFAFEHFSFLKTSE